MTPVLILTLSSFAALCLLFWMYRRLATPREWHTDLVLWWSEFNPARYDAMARLLYHEDAQFLRSLPGYRSGMDRRLRRQRIRAFESYLHELELDFHRLHALGSEIALASMSADLHNQLFQQRVRFSSAMWRIRLELIGYRLGIGRVDPSALLDAHDITIAMFNPALAAASL